jgi:hypothetical protein
MKFLYEEILDGLSEIPAPGAPGIMVVNGENSEAVFTGDNPSKVFLAASLFGDGRIFVCGHDCYYRWFVEKSGGLEGAFINNLKNWLNKGEPCDDSSIIESSKIKDDTELSKFKIILWHGARSISKQVYEKIEQFVLSGGSLFCAITLWGYMQNHKNETVKDVQIFNFLKDNTGIILTDKYFGGPTKYQLNKNKARFSNFKTAVDSVCSNVNEISNFCDTIDCCIDNLALCEIHDTDSVERMKHALINQCEAKGWSAIPSKKNPVKLPEVKQITKLLCTCFVELGEKAPNIQEFPFDFSEEPELLSDVTIRLTSKFSERLSTGFYLPAGVEISIRVVDGNPKDWKCRIGAHSDVLKPDSEYRRWPNCSVVKTLKKELNFKSSFGGLVYFDW